MAYNTQLSGRNPLFDLCPSSTFCYAWSPPITNRYQMPAQKIAYMGNLTITINMLVGIGNLPFNILGMKDKKHTNAKTITPAIKANIENST
jgi:hypothetical protein